MGYFYSHRTTPIVIWPWTQASFDIEFADGNDPGSAVKSVKTFGADDYLMSDAGAVVDAYADFIQTIQDKAQSAYFDIYGAGGSGVSVSIRDDGNILFTNAEANSLWIYGSGVGGGNTTIDLSIIGLANNATELVVGSTAGTGIVNYTWYAGIDARHDGADREHHLRFQVTGVDQLPSYSVHTDRPWYERFIYWDIVPGARVFDQYAAELTMADLAGIEEEEDMTFENLLLYLRTTDTTKYPVPRQVFIRNPYTNEIRGPYRVDMEQSGILQGYRESEIGDLSSEMYPVQLHLWRKYAYQVVGGGVGGGGGVDGDGINLVDPDLFGAGQVNPTIGFDFLDEGESFGAGGVDPELPGGVFVDPDAFGSHTVVAILIATVLVDGDSFGSHVVAAGVAGTLFVDPDTFPVGQLDLSNPGTLHVNPDTLSGGQVDVSNPATLLDDSTDTFGSHTVVAVLTQTTVVDIDTFGSSQVNVSNPATLLDDSTDTFGSSQVDPSNPATLLDDSTDTFGSSQVNVSLPGTTEVNTSTFGSSQVNVSLPGTTEVNTSTFGSSQVNVTLPQSSTLDDGLTIYPPTVST